MQKQNRSTDVRSLRIPHVGPTLLALAALAVVFIGTLALLPVLSVTAPDVPLAQERAEEHQWLAQRAATSAAVIVATQQYVQEEGYPLGFEQWPHDMIGQAAVNATQRQEELKDRWLGYQTADGQTMGDSPSRAIP